MDFFIEQMRAVGCEPANHSDIILDDKPHYYQRAGDKRGKKAVSYCLSERGGWVCDHKADMTYRIRLNGTSEAELTREERDTIKRVREAEKAERERRDMRQQARMERALGVIVERMPVADVHEYLTRKNIKPHGTRLRAKTGELVIPARNEAGRIQTIQKINGKWKGYQKGCKKRGAFYMINGVGHALVICEGFATGASVHEATGLTVYVAFDSGNLMPVAQAVRRMNPHAHVVFGADNDAWGERNTGYEKADEAARAIGNAHVVMPVFDAAPFTDFNDAQAVYGLEHVAQYFNEIPAEMQDEAPAEFYAPDEYNPHLGGGEPVPLGAVDGDFGMEFRCLGYNAGVFYYFPFASCQIVQLSASAHTMSNLLQLDALETWEARFGGSSEDVNHSKVAIKAADEMMQMCRVRGVFMQEDRIRGCGAWIDDGRVVLHTGDALYVDGVKMHFREIRSEFTYTASARLMRPSDNPLNNYEARRLRTICEALTWENPLSGSLLAGWLVIAPICAALTYRPHVYVTGQAESGKSTVINKIVKAVLGKMSLNVDGRTTEPSIRQRMGYDARPLVFDEAEISQSLDAVIDLARMASTGGIISKFGQPVFNARFCVCFSGINPPINKTSDESRFTFMVLKKNTRATAMQEYDDLMQLIEETITDDYSERMIARTLDNMQTLIANIRVFQRAARKTIGGARASEQIGTMLAGLYLLGRTDRISEDDAVKFIASHSWTEHTTIEQEGDPIKLVQHIATALVRSSVGGAEVSIGDLIGMVQTERDAPSIKLLKNYGVMVKDGRVFVASASQNLARLLKDTDWRIKWSRTLSDVPGAQKEKCVYFARGLKTSAVSLPVELFGLEELDW